MEQQTEQITDRIKEVIEGLNICEAEQLKAKGYTNECFFNSDGSLTKEYEWHLLEKQKYYYLNCGTSGAFMVAKEEVKGFPIGSIFNIKGYGTPNFKKWLGELKLINVELLHKLRWNYKR